MRVPPNFLKSVGYIAEVISGGEDYDLQGTGFFVKLPSTVLPGMFAHFFVTAKHIVKDLAGRKTAFIVNKIGGGVTGLPILLDRWFLHPTDATADVAVIPFGGTNELDICPISTEDFLLPADIASTKVTIGDEVFMPGLFTLAPGRERNMPIVRYGTIAMLPEEEIQVDSEFAEVYLIEARSIGGFSGSPVIARRTVAIEGLDKQNNTMLVDAISGFHLLGLVHGHWDSRESDLNKPSFVHDRQRGVNLGIGVVVPSRKIFETLNHPVLVAARTEAEEKARRDLSPGKDPSSAPDSS